jgi:hypothetical protein
MLANVNLNSDLQLLKSKVGRVVVVGNRGTIDINPRLLMTKETSVYGVTLFSSTDVRERNTYVFLFDLYLKLGGITNDQCLFTKWIESWLFKTIAWSNLSIRTSRTSSYRCDS